jgi:hypothetical protein
MTRNVAASSIDSIQLLKISPQDERAIIKTTDGKLQIIKPGDAVDNDSKVVEITAGRVVFEEKTGNEMETVIIRLEDGKQRVERIRKAPEKQVHLYSPRSAREKKQESNASAEGKTKDDKKNGPPQIKRNSVVD